MTLRVTVEIVRHGDEAQKSTVRELDVSLVDVDKPGGRERGLYELRESGEYITDLEHFRDNGAEFLAQLALKAYWLKRGQGRRYLDS